jgi:hypothetical protein
MGFISYFGGSYSSFAHRRSKENDAYNLVAMAQAISAFPIPSPLLG